MAKILIYGFGHPSDNISGQIVHKLSKSNCDTFLINTRYKSQAIADIQKLLVKIQTGDYHYVLGLGQFTSQKKLLKIETVCKNQFRNTKIFADNTPDTYTVSQFLVNQSQYISSSVISTKMGNSWCNFTAYRVARLIQINNLTCQSAFLHISRNFPFPELHKILNQAIANLLV